MNISNPSAAAANAKIKPLIGYLIDIKCGIRLCMNYLARDMPKMIAKVNVNEPKESFVGNKEMRQLCQTFKNMKSVKRMAIHLNGYQPQQLRILTKWLKTSRNLKSLWLTIPWGTQNPHRSLIETLFYIKNVKSLNDLTLQLWRNQSSLRLETLKPFMKLHHLSSLKKLKISLMTRTESNPRLSPSILSCLEGLNQLCQLDLDVSLLNHLPEMEIPRYMEYLKEIKNLRSLRLDLRYCGRLGDTLYEELISYLTSLEKLESFRLIGSIFSYLSFETTEEFIASVKNNHGLKNLILLTHSPFPKPDEEQFQCLNLKTLNQLTCLKLTLSANSNALNNHVLQDIAETLKENPRLEILNFDLFLKPLPLPSFTLFCKNLQKLENLKSFRLSLAKTLNPSDKEHIRVLAESLKSLIGLEKLHLDFSFCALSCKIVPLLADSVDSLQNLKTLYLNFSHPPAKFRDFVFFLKRTGIGSFGPVFRRHKNLNSITLRIADVKTTDQELEELAGGIGGLKTLTNLELHTSNFHASLYESFAKNTALSCLDLKLEEMKSQDLESLFEILQKGKNVKRMRLDFAVKILSEKAVENFKKMIQGLKSLRTMELSIFWDVNVDSNMILRFIDGMKYFDHFVDCPWQFFGKVNREREENDALKENSKYLRPLPSVVRYRPFNLLA